jgi:hypothetical protein
MANGFNYLAQSKVTARKGQILELCPHTSSRTRARPQPRRVRTSSPSAPLGGACASGQYRVMGTILRVLPDGPRHAPWARLDTPLQWRGEVPRCGEYSTGHIEAALRLPSRPGVERHGPTSRRGPTPTFAGRGHAHPRATAHGRRAPSTSNRSSIDGRPSAERLNGRLRFVQGLGHVECSLLCRVFSEFLTSGSGHPMIAQTPPASGPGASPHDSLPCHSASCHSSCTGSAPTAMGYAAPGPSLGARTRESPAVWPFAPEVTLAVARAAAMQCEPRSPAERATLLARLESLSEIPQNRGFTVY